MLVTFYRSYLHGTFLFPFFTKGIYKKCTKKELSDVTLDERLSIYKLIYMHKEDTEPKDDIA